MKKKGFLIWLVATFAVCNWAGMLYGHAAIVWAYVENNQVNVEAFFANGAKIQKARVIVVDANGDSVLEGETDTDGRFAYKPIAKETQTIVVMAGESHVGDFELTPEDLVEIVLE